MYFENPAAARRLAGVANSLLEQVRPALGAGVQQGQDVLRVRELAEHHHADLGVRLTQFLRDLDALVGVGGRHPDVCQHRLGQLLPDRVSQRLEIASAIQGLTKASGIDAA